MKTETWKHIGTIAGRIAARLKATREEISTLGREGAVTGSGNGNDEHPTVIADHAGGPEGERLRGFSEEKSRTYSRLSWRVERAGENNLGARPRCPGVAAGSVLAVGSAH